MFLNNIMIYIFYRYDEYSSSNIFNDKKTFNTNIIKKIIQIFTKNTFLLIYFLIT